jgi:dipeptidyl aminopeptidase/acylaminoacyl peptidase
LQELTLHELTLHERTLHERTLHDRTPETIDRQITSAPHGHILTNAGVWSPDGRLIAYDTRSDPAGAVFDGRSIETVDVDTGRVEVAYDAAPCGVVTFDTQRNRVVFIRGPAEPTPDWSYSPTHREGMLVDLARPGAAVSLDARDMIQPFTLGALRGGTHVHQFSPDGTLVSFTYEDDVLSRLPAGGGADRNARAVGVAVLGRPVDVPPGPHNLSGAAFSVLVTDLADQPGDRDQIVRAREEAWIGTAGYVRPDGTRQRHALAFVGDVGGHEEMFVADLPLDLTRPGDRPLQGTPTRRPAPPAGTFQRRLTRTAGRRFPGIAGPRHWPRSSPDGSAIAFLLADDDGIPHLHTTSPNGGPITPLTRGPLGIASSFTWSPDGRRIACVADRSVVTVDTATGRIDRLTAKSPPESAPRPEACIFSPDGCRIAYIRRVPDQRGEFNQVFVVSQ